MILLLPKTTGIKYCMEHQKYSKVPAKDLCFRSEWLSISVNIPIVQMFGTKSDCGKVSDLKALSHDKASLF